MQLTGKKIGIFGLAKTGIACFKYLVGVADSVICYDENPKQEFSTLFPLATFKPLNSSIWNSLDYIVVSPGIPLNFPMTHEVVKIAAQFSIPIISDIDILYSLCNKSYFIAVTGTNGKSTTTSLLSHILKEQDFVARGNIGIPALSTLNNKGYILELSSYQLDLLHFTKPKIAAILNITPDHQDRYPSMDCYIKSKLSIAKNMDKDGHLLLNLDDPILSFYQSDLSNTNVLTFGVENSKSNFNYKNGVIYNNLDNSTVDIKTQLVGTHNIYNILASFGISFLLNVSNYSFAEKVKSFNGIAHRLELVGHMDNIKFYNDSKATNKESSFAALSSLNNIFWLAGGLAKKGKIEGLDLNNVHKAYFFGDARFDFANYVKSLAIECFTAEGLQEVLEKAIIDARKAKVQVNILLSPACASFDQFKNFEDRGEKFTHLVKKHIQDLNK